jgi:hypothetical protein
VAEGSKEISGPRPRRFQLWQDLRGKTGYRVFGALILDDLCRKADLSTAAMLRALRKELDRPLSRQSLAAWRRGDLATPNEVLLATYAVVGRTLAEPSLTVAMRVLADPDADPRLAERLRLYYGSGRAALPTERPSWFARAVGETKRRKRAAPGAAQPPPWRDLRGKTRYRMFGALILDELCRESDINAEELRRRLRRELRRPLSRQTLAAWRRGVQAVPNDVLIATAGIVHRTLGEASVVIAMRVLSDPAADRQFVEMLHAFYADRRE